jgi:hypothetical protein
MGNKVKRKVIIINDNGAFKGRWFISSCEATYNKKGIFTGYVCAIKRRINNKIQDSTIILPKPRQDKGQNKEKPTLQIFSSKIFLPPVQTQNFTLHEMEVEDTQINQEVETIISIMEKYSFNDTNKLPI